MHALHGRQRALCKRSLLLGLLLGLAMLAPSVAQAFALAMDPPRMEVRLEPGAVSRHVIELTQVDMQPLHLRVYTNDWELGQDNQLRFLGALQPGSCRPWLALESREVHLQPRVRKRYRIEIAVPADAPARECRLAVMFEGAPIMAPAGGITVPVSGRLAAIIYAAVGDVQAQPELREAQWVLQDGRWVPALVIHNAGQATARPAGQLTIERSGMRWSFEIQSAPVLPGRTAVLALSPVEEGTPELDATQTHRVSGRISLGYAQASPLVVEVDLQGQEGLQGG